MGEEQQPQEPQASPELQQPVEGAADAATPEPTTPTPLISATDLFRPGGIPAAPTPGTEAWAIPPVASGLPSEDMQTVHALNAGMAAHPENFAVTGQQPEAPAAPDAAPSTPQEPGEPQQ